MTEEPRALVAATKGGDKEAASPGRPLMRRLNSERVHLMSNTDILATTMLMSMARHVDFTGAYLAAPDDHVSDAGHTP